MNCAATPKKVMAATILASCLHLVISQAAFAEPAKEMQAQTQSKPAVQRPCRQAHMNPDMFKSHEKFLHDTVAIRKQLAEKNAVMRALLNAGTPDTLKASQVAGELFELREQLRAKAIEAGLPMPMMMGHGDDSMPCQGMPGKHHRMNM